MPRRPASPLHLQSSEELNHQLSKPTNNVRAPSPSSKGQRAVSKIACAFSALKCSSRALEDKDYEQHRRRDPDFVHPSDSPTQFLSSQELDDSLPRMIVPQGSSTLHQHPDSYVSDESSTGSEASERLWKIATVLVEGGDDDDAHRPLPPTQRLSQRNDSEDTQDTQDTSDTPNTSNRDPARERLSIDTQSSDLPDAAFDAFCEEHYNAPRTIRSKGSLGDSITPLASPEQEAGHPPHSPVVDKPSDPSLLALPSMPLPATASSSERRRSVASSAASSSLAGEFCLDASTTLVGSKAVANGNALNLHADQASVRIGQQELRAATQSKPSQTSTMLNSSTYQSLSKNEDSSYSSVSSFADVHGQPNRSLPQHQRNKQVGGKALTPHPFFWRSHPTTVTRSDHSVSAPSAYDYEYSQTPPQYHVYDTSRTHSFKRQAQSPDSFSDWHSPDLRHTESKQTYLDPNIVRNMWMESKPFGLSVNTQWKVNGNSLRHPQGPPSTRSAALVQSLTSFATNRLPSVFARSESTRLEQHTV